MARHRLLPVRSRRDSTALDPKGRAAFRSGFLGIGSFGWSTLAVVTDASEAERAAAVEQLAQQLVERLGAPDLATARRGGARGDRLRRLARAIIPTRPCSRSTARVEDGEIRERFRTLTPRPAHDTQGFRAFEFLEVEGEDEGVAEEVDLLSLGKTARP